MALIGWLRLTLGSGPVLGHRLLDAFGSPEDVFAASRLELKRVEGVGEARVARLLDPQW